MTTLQTITLPVQGMDCTTCAQHIERDLSLLPGVQHAQVLLSAEKATVQFDSTQLDRATLVRRIEQSGYRVPSASDAAPAAADLGTLSSSIIVVFGLIFLAVIGLVILGEQFGWLDALTTVVPWPIGLALVLVGGFPIFRSVIRSALKGTVISHTLMSVGVVAALVIGEWPTAVLVVLFMRTGEYAERFTTERARRAVKDLTAMAPKTARVERNGHAMTIPLDAVLVGDVVIVRPGDAIPVDGTVVSGRATVNQAAITGESMPVEVGPDQTVFAATLAAAGSLRVQATAVGADSTFGKVIALVEEAEAHRADVQRIGDTFSAYYLPVVAGIAILTFLLRHDPLATAAVLLVACSCSFALATPIAMLASIGAAAKQGMLIKGGKYIEALAQADVLLVDKTGTLTVGRPTVTAIVPLDTTPAAEVLAMAAAAERDSEHPLAAAIRQAAQRRRLPVQAPESFTAVPGHGIRAQIGADTIMVGNQRMVGDGAAHPEGDRLEAAGNTVVAVARNGAVIGLIALADTVRPEITDALAAIRAQGIGTIEMLTGDNARVAAALASQVGISYRANLLPEDKIAVVRDYQSKGHRVVMIGDGVNDAPALAQAHVGIAMGVVGTDVALEAAHIALMRDDWMLVPAVLAVAKRTMQVVKGNIAFTAMYNLVGLTLAALGVLPPVFAAAAQSLPDLGIMANSARLLRLRGIPKRRATTIPVAERAADSCTDGCCTLAEPATAIIPLQDRRL
ncbi:heavy metal translocating P-type ATPase [Herpetosiphon giganteus]|uniref:heavy metal translocating P-type ATPase n=1 Tax=Herpetosiphon giganteus TaxID=2029754 RepID=UPI00195C64A2|nr:cation-translocating P-type ATPase [Herpetosiphon giganteus]MBM7846486.1 Cd2+/Zn2+-exporting ATPase/Cu+-exporting ATPase [Herpetosiphon giganteus]